MPALTKDDRILVVGAGAMGSGIAQVAASAGHEVSLYDVQPDAAQRACAGIERDLGAQVARGRIDRSEAVAILERVAAVATLAEARDASLAIEAIVENLTVKQGLLRELEGVLGGGAILASNTSALSITAMAAALKHPERLVGMHFFNPVPRMKLVEIVSGLETGAAQAASLYATAQAWGKIAVHVKSTPGFIVNRVARPYYAEALRVLAEGGCDPASLDAVLRDGCGFPMGPFELMDFIGHDINFAVTRSVFDACFGDRRYAPSLIQQEMVAAGRLGRKSGRGFYDYAEGAARPVPKLHPPCDGLARIAVIGDVGPAAPLIARFEAAGIEVRREAGRGAPGWMEVGDARLALSDGRTATCRAAEEQCPNLVLFDLCLDYATTSRLTLASADQCGRGASRAVAGTLQRAGFKVGMIDDVAGMVALRTIAMLANEAADVVLQGIASAAEVDAAMVHGTRYPDGGPLTWADRLGAGFLTGVLHRLREHYGEERYRASPLLQRKAFNAEPLHD